MLKSTMYENCKNIKIFSTEGMINHVSSSDAGEFVIATCQFPVSADIKKNASYILKQIARAKEKGADICHFPESSLSGYAGADFKSFKRQDESLLQGALKKIAHLSSALKIWVIVGSHHFEKNHEQPYNCLWSIDHNGEIINRYDKRFCTGKEGELDHYYYKAGQSTVQFKINDVTCGLLICHEWRYPELYREQKQLGTEILFQSWYDGNLSGNEYKEQGEELGSLIVGTVRGNAANNYLWISASNTSKRESCFASFVVRPDGKIHHKLKRNVTGILISKINVNSRFADPSGPWRERAYEGILHTGIL
jgi:predicted amidohydrolase